MPTSIFKPYGPGELKALHTLGLKCDKETGRTEPFEWKKSKYGRLSLATRNARLAAMKLLGIQENQCWQRPLAQ